MIEVKDIGQLTQRVQILAPTTSVGANGERLETWGEYATRWMRVEPLGASESVSDDMGLSVVRAKFTARYDSTINEKYRFVWNSQTWNIRGIEFTADKMFSAFVCDSNTVTGATTTDYGDYYATNSLKIRYITTGESVTATPTVAEINTAVGLTAATAGSGYIAGIKFTYTVFEPPDYVDAYSYCVVISDGTNWHYYSTTIAT